MLTLSELQARVFQLDQLPAYFNHKGLDFLSDAFGLSASYVLRAAAGRLTIEVSPRYDEAFNLFELLPVLAKSKAKTAKLLPNSLVVLTWES